LESTSVNHCGKHHALTLEITWMMLLATGMSVLSTRACLSTPSMPVVSLIVLPLCQKAFAPFLTLTYSLALMLIQTRNAELQWFFHAQKADLYC